MQKSIIKTDDKTGFDIKDIHNNMGEFRKTFKRETKDNNVALAGITMKFLAGFYKELLTLKVEDNIVLCEDAQVYFEREGKASKFKIDEKYFVESFDDIQTEIIKIFNSFIIPVVEGLKVSLNLNSADIPYENVFYAFYREVMDKEDKELEKILRGIDFTKLGLKEKFNDIEYKLIYSEKMGKEVIQRRVCCQKIFLLEGAPKCPVCPVTK